MIRVSGITKNDGDRIAVDNMSFDVAAGTVTGFVGPNGAGESTALPGVGCGRCARGA